MKTLTRKFISSRNPNAAKQIARFTGTSCKSRSYLFSMGANTASPSTFSLRISFIMEEHTPTTSVLTIGQCQCLIQIWEKITYALVFTGQDTTLYQAMRGARSVLNSDQATVNNARNRLARKFANLSIAKFEQLTLSHLTSAISGARTIRWVKCSSRDFSSKDIQKLITFYIIYQLIFGLKI